MPFINTLRRKQEPRRAAATWAAATGTWAAAAATRPAEAVPAPRRRLPARDLPAAEPGSLAASVLAAGLNNVDLGLERLGASRGRSWPVWPLGLLLGICCIVAAGVLWQQAPATSANLPAVGERAAAPAAPPVSLPLDPETRRAAIASPPAPETVPGPGGLAMSIRPVESNYTVVAGDTLERIAQRFGTTIDALVGMNNLRDRNSLTVGQQLIIP